jgi:1-pyrroline-5-carboxylate dehydrogenase
MMILNALINIKRPPNEPTLGYLSGSEERAHLWSKLEELKAKRLDIPLIIGGNEIRTDNIGESVMPHKHHHVLANYHKAGKEEVLQAIDVALDARKTWSQMPWNERAAIFLRAADMIAGKERQTLNAATMLDLSKNIYQAEIDATNELVDFLRFNVYYMSKIYEMQPDSPSGERNRIEYRPLEGFIFAVTPFNFVSIMGNLPTAPAILGNVVLWKPASNAVYVSYHVMKILVDAGVPPGVINFIPGPGADIGETVLDHPSLAGIHFTGSTSTFKRLLKKVAENIHLYKTYPRLVGETGGKDFVFVHNSADIDGTITALIRGAFEYQGQKCSAVSRAYIPESIWPTIQDRLISEVKRIKMGDVQEIDTLVNAVIDNAAFDKITDYIEYARASKETKILVGGEYDKNVGYFISPTIVVTDNPKSKMMEEEIFGPVLTIYTYHDDQFKETLELCDQTSPYALTGSIFSKDRKAIELATRMLENAAGNFYINDKPTGAVVGRQPFGGARASGTNDKAGSRANMMRWISMRTIKENLSPPRRVSYDYMNSN